MRGRVRRSHWRWALIAPTKSISVMLAIAGERRWSHSDECLSGIRVSRKGDLLIAHGPCITISPHKAG
jgi:hypothetical protein